jgi:hypothetical protein
MLYQIIADGIVWIDSDGGSEFHRREAITLAAALENIGYQIELVKVY